MNVLRTTEDAVSLLPAPTYLTASIAPAILDTPVMVLPVQVRSHYSKLLVLAFRRIFGSGKKLLKPKCENK